MKDRSVRNGQGSIGGVSRGILARPDGFPIGLRYPMAITRSRCSQVADLFELHPAFPAEQVAWRYRHSHMGKMNVEVTVPRATQRERLIAVA